MLTVEPSEIIINNDYQYEDSDMIGILKIRMRQLQIPSIIYSPDYPIGTTAISLKHYLAEEHAEHQGARILLIPYNVEGYHWIGILLAINDDEKVEKIVSLDSLGKGEYSREIVTAAILEASSVYPELRNKTISFASGWLQKDITSCGPLTIENLLLMARAAKLPDTTIKPAKLKKIRKKHVKLYSETNSSFYERQRNNINRVASFHQQQEWLATAGTHFTFFELKNITEVIKLLQQLEHQTFQKEILEFFSPKFESHKKHLDNIRENLIRLRDRINLGSEEENIFYQLVKVLFDLEPVEAKKSDFNTHYKLPYEAFKVIIDNVNISEEQIDRIHTNVQRQIEEDEKLAKALQEKLWNENNSAPSARKSKSPIHLREDKTGGVKLSFDTWAFYRMPPIRIRVMIGYDRPKDECFLWTETINKGDSTYSSPSELDSCFYNSLQDKNFHSYIPPEVSSFFDELSRRTKAAENVSSLVYPKEVSRKKEKDYEDLLRFIKVFSRYKIYIPIEIYEILSNDKICCVTSKVGYSGLVEDVSMLAYKLYQDNSLDYYKEFYNLIKGLNYVNPLDMDKKNDVKKETAALKVSTLPRRNRLTLGEADFSFADAFMRKHSHRGNISKKVVFTEYRKKDDVTAVYKGWELYWIEKFNGDLTKNSENAVVFCGKNKADLTAYFIEAIEDRKNGKKEEKYVFKKRAKSRDFLSIKTSFTTDHDKIDFDPKTGRAMRTHKTADIIDTIIGNAIAKAGFTPNVHYISFPTHQIHLHQLGAAMEFGIDAQNIHEIYAGEHFKRIHFNCPHDKQDSKGRTLPTMLSNFFNSAKFLQRIGDRINMALPTPLDKEQRQNRESYIYKVYDAASSSGYRLIKKRKFGDQRYPGYWHVMTGKSKTAEVAEHLIEYIFEKIEPNDHEAIHVIHYKSPTLQKTHYVGKPHQDIGHVLPDIDTDDDSSEYNSSDDESTNDIMQALKMEDSSRRAFYGETALPLSEVTPSILERARKVSSEYHRVDVNHVDESLESPSANITKQFSNFKISRQKLEEAIDFMISIEPDPEAMDDYKDYEKVMEKYAKEIQEAELIIKQYGNQLAASEMQNEFYSIVQSKKYMQSTKHQSVTYAALNHGWHDIKGWKM